MEMALNQEILPVDDIAYGTIAATKNFSNYEIINLGGGKSISIIY